MTKLFFEAPNCQAATSERTGKTYYTDKQGFINVPDAGDAAFFKKNGYHEAGSTRTHSGKYWVCDECDWESNLNHCRHCDSENLRKVTT